MPDCSAVSSDMTRGNGYQVKKKKKQSRIFDLNKRKYFSHVVARHWNRLPREAVKFPS